MSPKHSDFPMPSERPCHATTREILDRVGDKWSLYIVGTLSQGPRRFNEIKRLVDGISQRMLTLNLRGLERDGLVTRTIYPTIPPRVDYALTDLGYTLLTPVMALVDWADANQARIVGARVRYDGAESSESTATQIRNRSLAAPIA